MLIVLICALLRQSACLPHRVALRHRDRGRDWACAPPPSQVVSLCHTHYKLILLKTVLPPNQKVFLAPLCLYDSLLLSLQVVQNGLLFSLSVHLLAHLNLHLQNEVLPKSSCYEKAALDVVGAYITSSMMEYVKHSHIVFSVATDRQ